MNKRCKLDSTTNTFIIAYDRFHKSKKITDNLCFDCYNDLNKQLQNLPGIGPLRAAHIIQLSALLGLIPIHLYIYILPNFNMKKGPTVFFKEQMFWDKSSLKSNYMKELSELQKLYSNNFTSNIFENTSCIIGRSKQKKDVFYHFPVFEKDKVLSRNETMIQLVFRVKVIDIHNIFLLCKPSTTSNEFTVFDTKSNKKSKTIISFNRIENRKNNSSSSISNNNHFFDERFISRFIVNNNSSTTSNLFNTFFNTQELPSFNNHYNTNQQISQYDSWNQFSVIHSTPGNKFNFIVYNASHRLKNNERVNPKTKTMISFPTNGSYFIIFHGRLVHSGGCSITTSDNQAEQSTRLFSYLNVPLHNVISTSQRRSQRLTNYTVNVKENTVDTHSFKFDIKSLEHDSPVHTLILPENVNIERCTTQIPVAGNMIEHGWEVYHGVDFKKSRFKNFNNDISTLVNKHTSKFNKISQTNRSSYDIGTLDARLNKSIKSLQSLYRVFNDLLQNYLRKIPYLEEVVLHKNIVLCNLGHVKEQIPHRDYSSVKK